MASRKRDAPEGGDLQPPPNGTGRAQKRSRKAVNCEPCRASKLKCDRKRPCSGCEIRGTTDQCYPEETGANGTSAETSSSQVDVRTEIERIQASLRILEAGLPRQGGFSSTLQSGTKTPGAGQDHSVDGPATWEKYSKLAQRPSPGNLYIGPSAPTVSLLISRHEITGIPEGVDPDMEWLDKSTNGAILHEYESLPHQDGLVDRLLHLFFDSCTYLTYIIEPKTWFTAWQQQRANNEKINVVTLATAYTMMAIAMNYLPEGDSLVARLPQDVTPIDLGRRWNNSAVNCLTRQRLLKAPPSLELVELLLLRAQYLSMSETSSTELWAVKSDLGAATYALGLHRDPGNWKMTAQAIVRRRWAWWNFLSLERSQAFMFGRPLTVQPNHFDTKFPVDDEPTPSAKVYDHPHLVHLARFRLVVILGDILQETLSPKPASYERVKVHDRALERWRDALPPDLRLSDPQGVARGLTISTPAKVRSITLQSISLRVQMHHIRFVLHQQYASPRFCGLDKGGGVEADPKHPSMSDNFDAAVHSAGMVIDFLREMIPMCSSNLFLALPGHVSWTENALFSAALFFAVLLIDRPDQSNREVFREHIQHAMHCLTQLEHYVPHAGKGRLVLQALTPLFTDDLDEAGRIEQIEAVRSLTFPSHEGPLFSLRKSLRTFTRPTEPRTRARKLDYTASDGQLPGEIILRPPSSSAATSKSSQLLPPIPDDEGGSEYMESEVEEDDAMGNGQLGPPPGSLPTPQTDAHSVSVYIDQSSYGDIPPPATVSSSSGTHEFTFTPPAPVQRSPPVSQSAPQLVPPPARQQSDQFYSNQHLRPQPSPPSAISHPSYPPIDPRPRVQSSLSNAPMPSRPQTADSAFATPGLPMSSPPTAESMQRPTTGGYPRMQQSQRFPDQARAAPQFQSQPPPRAVYEPPPTAPAPVPANSFYMQPHLSHSSPNFGYPSLSAEQQYRPSSAGGTIPSSFDPMLESPMSSTPSYPPPMQYSGISQYSPPAEKPQQLYEPQFNGHSIPPPVSYPPMLQEYGVMSQPAQMDYSHMARNGGYPMPQQGEMHHQHVPQLEQQQYHPEHDPVMAQQSRSWTNTNAYWAS